MYLLYTRKFFSINVYFRKWWNDCFVTKWQMNFHIIKKHTKMNKFCIFFIWCFVQKVMKWLLCDHIRATLSLFIRNSQIEYQTEQLLLEKCFNLMLSVQSNEMTVFKRRRVASIRPNVCRSVCRSVGRSVCV